MTSPVPARIREENVHPKLEYGITGNSAHLTPPTTAVPAHLTPPTLELGVKKSGHLAEKERLRSGESDAIAKRHGH